MFRNIISEAAMAKLAGGFQDPPAEICSLLVVIVIVVIVIVIVVMVIIVMRVSVS